MKKVLFLVPALIFSIQTFAQNYVPMPESDVIWGQDHYGATCYNELNLCSEFQYTFGGDTTINLTSYKILNRSGYLYDNDLVPTWFFEYAGGFRQDIENKQVFFMERNKTEEELLYDFKLNVGDTLPPAYNNHDDVVVVTSIDSVLVGNQYRKRFHLETFMGEPSLIEGIGSDVGLLEPLSSGEDTHRLQCFNLNDSIYFPDYNFLCDLITGIHETALNKMALEIIPNPFNTATTITYELQRPSTVQITIYNHIGKQVELIQQKQAQGKQQVVWRAEGFPAGVYYFILQAGKQVGTGKMVIMR